MKIKLPDDEALCEYCQDHVIERRACTAHFMCEGRFCKDALEHWKDNEWANNCEVTEPGMQDLNGALVKCKNCLYNTYDGWTSVDGDPCVTCSAVGSNKIEAS